MKNIYLIIFAFIPFLFFGQSVDFKIKYTPQTKYLQKVKQSIENTLQYTASDDILEKLKEKNKQRNVQKFVTQLAGLGFSVRLSPTA